MCWTKEESNVVGGKVNWLKQVKVNLGAIFISRSRSNDFVPLFFSLAYEEVERYYNMGEIIILESSRSAIL